ncbi:hypothetical protein NPIL_13541 [Nephila pilipes]|uniref:Uncharacterized protein n=1 Tax=Nephila pilipes TaxID=299642 RepID=A0A8X6TVY8_NEPPI|nr:hypothetical protein NPIL_13541 [Nephila pilipes]
MHQCCKEKHIFTGFSEWQNMHTEVVKEIEHQRPSLQNRKMAPELRLLRTDTHFIVLAQMMTPAPASSLLHQQLVPADDCPPSAWPMIFPRQSAHREKSLWDYLNRPLVSMELATRI